MIDAESKEDLIGGLKASLYAKKKGEETRGVRKV